jgi:transcriptional/translational regulatory protein YebC/TACO1
LFINLSCKQKFIVNFEENQYEIVESGFDRIPTMTKKLTPEQEIDVKKLLDKMEDDDDVQDVYSTME